MRSRELESKEVIDRQEMNWQRNPELRASPFDDGRGKRWLLELDDATGKTQRVLVSTPVYAALDQFIEPRRIDSVLDGLRASGWSDAGLQQLESALLETCAGKNILLADNAQTQHAPLQPGRPPYLSLMIQLLPPTLVNFLARRLAVLFSTPGIAFGVSAIIAGQIALLVALSTPVFGRMVTSENVLLTVGLALVVVLLHELGHATAAWRGGARRVGIGVGWYVCFPVAYAELSEIWRLPRRQRAMIDVAGIYMQGLAVAGLMLFHYQQPSAAVLAAAAAASLSILWNMNPLLRMDGYWFLSDLLGTPNLRTDATTALRGNWRRWRGLPEASTTAAMSPRYAMLISSYALASSAFLIVMLVFALIHFRDGLLIEIPQHARRLLQADWLQLGWADGVLLAGSIAWKLLLLALLGRYLLGLAFAQIRRTARWLHRGDNFADGVSAPDR